MANHPVSLCSFSPVQANRFLLWGVEWHDEEKGRIMLFSIVQPLQNLPSNQGNIWINSEFMCISGLNHTCFSSWWTWRCGLKIFSILLLCLNLVSEWFSVSFFFHCAHPCWSPQSISLWTTCTISCTLPRFTRIASFPLPFTLGIKYTVNGSTGRRLY